MTETSKPSTAKYWVLALISAVAFVCFLMFLPGFFWVTLPFLLTFLAAAMRLI